MTGMITSLLQTVDNITQQFIFSGYQNLAQAYTPAVYGLVGLAITAYGYAIVNGWVALAFSEFIKRVLIIGFVVALALHWDIFSEYVYDFFTNAPNDIASNIVKAIPNSQISDETSVYNALQQAFYDGMSFASASWDHGSIPNNVAPYLWSIAIYILIFVITALAVVELIAAKFGMAIYLVLAPIIIPMFLFPVTKQAVFDGWLRHLVGFALIPIYIMSTIALSLMLMVVPTQSIQNAINSDSLTMTNISFYALAALIVAILLGIATSMAISTSGGFSTSLANRLENTASNARRSLTSMVGKNKNQGETHIHVGGDGNNLNFNYGNKSNPPDPNRTIHKESNNSSK